MRDMVEHPFDIAPRAATEPATEPRPTAPRTLAVAEGSQRVDSTSSRSRSGEEAATRARGPDRRADHRLDGIASRPGADGTAPAQG